MEHSTDAAVVRAHEHDYDGTHVLRGFRIGFALAGLVWLSLALVACAGIGLDPSDRARGVEGHLTARNTMDCGDVPLPPPAFDHVAAIPVLIRHVSFDAVDRECRDHGVEGPRTAISVGPHSMSPVALLNQYTHGDYETKACSWTFARLGFVVLPEIGKAGVTETWEACALRHEIGHINGWPTTHPLARYEDSAPLGWF